MKSEISFNLLFAAALLLYGNHASAEVAADKKALLGLTFDCKDPEVIYLNVTNESNQQISLVRDALHLLELGVFDISNTDKPVKLKRLHYPIMQYAPLRLMPGEKKQLAIDLVLLFQEYDVKSDKDYALEFSPKKTKGVIFNDFKAQFVFQRKKLFVKNCPSISLE